MAGYREKTARDIANGIIDYEKMYSSLPERYQKTIQKNFKLIEKYGKLNGLTPAQVQELKNMEILVARAAYLEERNEENARTQDELAQRDTARNNEELKAIEAQYKLKESTLGKHPSALNTFIEKENTKKSTR